MSGIEIGPVVRTFATAVPEIIPMRLDPTTAALAGPPRIRPVIAVAKSIRTCPAPVFSRSAPSTTTLVTKVALTPSGVPKTPPPPR